MQARAFYPSPVNLIRERHMEKVYKSPSSPWSPSHLPNALKINGFQSTEPAAVTIPGSKSFSNRALILAACSPGSTTLYGLLKSDDTYWCIDALSKIGVKFEFDGDKTTVHTPERLSPTSEENLFIGAAGTVARFLPGVLASVTNANFYLEADESLSKRPNDTLYGALRTLGANITKTSPEHSFPVRISSQGLAQGLKGGHVHLDADVSSQYLSGLLICAPRCGEPVTIELNGPIVQSRYVAMTIETMKQFGAHVEVSNDFNLFQVTPSQYTPTNLTVEADLSAACYFFAAGALTEHAITVTGINKNTLQPDIHVLDILTQMGCNVEWHKADHLYDVTVKGPTKLKGGQTFDMTSCSDQALTIGCIAAFADGPVTITGIGHIRKHECDRVEALREGLTSLGVKCETTHSTVTVHPAEETKLKPASIRTYHDHRVAMAFSLIGAKLPGIEIENPSCVSKTFPDFFDTLESAGYITSK